MPMRCVLLTLLLSLPATAQQIVHLKAGDGQPLVGTYHAPTGASQGGILLLHMYRSTRMAWRPLASRLARAGFHVLALDMRGHGDSAKDPSGRRIDVSRQATKDPTKNPFLKMHADAKTGLDLLVERGAPKGRLAIVGASVGCSVALHTAQQYRETVAAVVLMTPGTNYLNVPSLEHAASFGNRPALILSSQDEADLGARPVKAKMTGEKVELRLLEEKAIHGTRMFGRVDAIEADIIDWLKSALLKSVVLQIPVTKDLFIDGDIDKEEGVGATRSDIPLENGKTAVLRISRNRRRIVIGFSVPERYIRRNAVVVYIHGTETADPAPTVASIKVSFNPVNTEREPLLAWRGTETGAWKETKIEGIQSYAKTRGKGRWTAELAIPVSEILGEGVAAPAKIRIAFQIDGQKEGLQRFLPASANIKTSPATWIPALLAGL